MPSRLTLRLSVLALAAMLAIAVTAAVTRAADRPAAEKAPEFDPKLIKALTFRSIGPANMGGRISDLAVVEKKPATFYAATGTGGLFKTTNMGTTWTPVFDKEAVASIGAVALWQKNPDVVWVGTGEANSRNSSSWGKGVYRSQDGGANWKCMGLEATSAIARVVTDPGDSNTVYVAALGRLWGENAERGVFRTKDGGKTWTHVLKVDAHTGAVDLVMDPGDPRILYAAMYARRRSAFSYSAGGETGGIFKSTDGGETWAKLTNGLPARTGRIGLNIYRKNPKIVYAVVESDAGGRLSAFEEASREGGVFRSDDAGASWKRLSPFAPRAFYFSQIRVQPDDSTRVYLCGTDLYFSDDGGVTFKSGGAKNIHPDCHALWIDPSDGNHVIVGNDGGVYMSFDRIATWRFLNNLAIGEFYNLAADFREPFYHVYGGLQDNQSWGGPSRTLLDAESFDGSQGAGQAVDQWAVLGGGDGFHVAVDPTNPDLVYYESQGGEILRHDLRSGRDRSLKPAENEGETQFRFNWNTPFLISPHDPSVLYMGGQYVFKLTEHGDRWQKVSPDLTTLDLKKAYAGGSGAEMHCTVVSLTESALRAGQLWAGTDDGKVWMTQDGGKVWSDLTGNIKGVPANLYVSRVEASHIDPNTAFVSFDGHRSDVFAPFVFVTHDLGRTWTSIAGDLPKDFTVKVIRQDLANADLLFAGTEFGLFFTFDGGKKWMPLKNGLPTVAVDDILIHARERDLIVATHGRSIWIMDGIQSLEAFTSATMRDTVSFAPTRTAWEFYAQPLGGKWGQADFLAKNPPPGAWFDYFLPKELEGGVSFAVTDSAGHDVRTLEGPGEAGFHRVAWDLVAGDPKTRIIREEFAGQPQFVAPGVYKSKLTAGKTKPQERSFEVKAMPGTRASGL